jgi:hypothetical protein
MDAFTAKEWATQGQPIPTSYDLKKCYIMLLCKVTFKIFLTLCQNMISMTRCTWHKQLTHLKRTNPFEKDLVIIMDAMF